MRDVRMVYCMKSEHFIDNRLLSCPFSFIRHDHHKLRGERNTKFSYLQAKESIEHLNRKKLLKKKNNMSELRFDGKVALVTGAGT